MEILESGLFESLMKTEKMKTVVNINWKLREIFGKNLMKDKPFSDWCKQVLGSPASRKTLAMIKERDNIQPAIGKAEA